jgi:hypothetical protein
MNEFHKSSELISALKKRLSSQKKLVIGIDGIDGCGKTTLAKELNEALVIPFFSTDDYLNKQKGSYIEHIRYKQLLKAIERVNGSIIIEGVCLLCIAEQIKINISDLVYIKIMSPWKFWVDEEVCDPEDPVDQLIERLIKEANLIPPDIFGLKESNEKTKESLTGLKPFVEQVIRYHSEYRPSRKAKYIYFKERAH